MITTASNSATWKYSFIVRAVKTRRSEFCNVYVTYVHVLVAKLTTTQVLTHKTRDSLGVL